MADKKYKLKFGMSDGTEKSVEFTAPQGEPGITPVVAVSDITGGHRVTITTGNNVQTIDVLDGKNGDPGKDGITPTVSVTEIEGGHRVTITTGSNVQSFDVLDGKDGEGGGTADAVAWENVTGKPFDESLTGTAVVNGDTLSWDGNLDAMPIVVTPNNYNKWIYVSDNVPTMEQISAGHTLAFKAYNGSEININITPSESENYIYVGDMDGQYLYIIKKPCTVGSMVFERAGIYFYSDSKATIYTCRLTINGYTFTEMGGIKDAYIPQTIARKSDIPQGGGAQVQSDYTQHDANQPDYIKNRPLWPEWSPVLFCESLETYGYGGVVTANTSTMVGSVFAVPIEGQRYTFGVNGKSYSGIAKFGNFSYGNTNYDGIGIDAENVDNVRAIYIDMFGITAWMFQVLGDDVDSDDEYAFFFVIEGDNPYNKLSVPDDVINMGAASMEGVNVVRDLVSLVKLAQSGDEKAVRMYEAFGSDFEIVVDINGTEITLTKDAVQFVQGTNLMGYNCDAYMYGSTPLAAIIYAQMSGVDVIMLTLLDLNALGMGAVTTKSIKVNYPGIFAPIVAAKKMPSECLPGAFIAYISKVNTDTYTPHICSDSEYRNQIKAESIMNAFRAGIPIYVCVINGGADVNTYYSVARIVDEKSSSTPKVNLFFVYSDMTLCKCYAPY